MKKISFAIEVEAPVSLVYQTMIDDTFYREWTRAFNATSHYQGSWAKGSKILFIGIDEQGERGGMVSRIRENIANQFISIEHLGLLQGAEEITSGPEVEAWAGALENYRFSGDKGTTQLTIEMDSNEEFESYFKETWPKALAKLKAICESRLFVAGSLPARH